VPEEWTAGTVRIKPLVRQPWVAHDNLQLPTRQARANPSRLGLAHRDVSPVPRLPRIAILERTDRDKPNRRWQFDWGCMHGSVAGYSESSSTQGNDPKVMTSYAPHWDLFRCVRPMVRSIREKKWEIT
jgi:hypothetical protein